MLPHLTIAIHSSQTPVMVFICHFVSHRCPLKLITSPHLKFWPLDHVSDVYGMFKTYCCFPLNICNSESTLF